jgi:Na+/melibiose symporter-like transporter
MSKGLSCLGPWQALTATLTDDPTAIRAIQQSAPVLLLGGGIFFIFLFFHRLFLEPKAYGLPGERFFTRQGAWFYAIVSVALTATVWFDHIFHNPRLQASC